MIMCIELEKRPPRKYVSSKFSENTLVYSLNIDKSEPDTFRVNFDEIAFVLCPDGSKHRLMEAGYYKVIMKPTRVIWIKKVPREIKVGVPREATGIDIGFHARIRLYPMNWNLILEYFNFNEKEEEILIDNVKDIVKESALQALLAVKDKIHGDHAELKNAFNNQLNQILMTTKLAGFMAVVSHLGFSTMCKLPSEIMEVVSP